MYLVSRRFFIALGTGAAAISRLLLAYRYETNLVGGGIIIVFGIFMIGLVPMPWLHREMRFPGISGGGRLVGAYVSGLAFGFGWTPCIGPVLGAKTHGFIQLASVFHFC